MAFLKGGLEGRRAFVSDAILRSFESVDAIYDYLPSCGIPQESLHDVIQDRDRGGLSRILESVYYAIRSSMKQNVKMRHGGVDFDVSDVCFHEQFGWTVISEIGKAYLGKIILSPSVPVRMGLMSYLSGRSTVRGGDAFEVGSFSSLASELYVTTSDYSHPTEFPSTFNFKGNARVVSEGMNFDISFQTGKSVRNGIFIGSDVWIGRDVSIKNGVSLGNGCVIGGKALVVKDCEPYGIYGGVPARLIRYRFSEEVIERLLELAWWDWPYEKIASNRRFFDTDLTSYTGSLDELIV